ncbi:MAG: DUF1579 family protein [Planctomycetes bacterium]|nr:DUF1579 family protein [Planctomycetota bacterium]
MNTRIAAVLVAAGLTGAAFAQQSTHQTTTTTGKQPATTAKQNTTTSTGKQNTTTTTNTTGKTTRQPGTTTGVTKTTGTTKLDPAAAANLPGHEQIELTNLFTGDWTANATCYGGQNGQAVKSTGTARFAPSFGGRFVSTAFDSQFNNNPFKGVGFYGYNNGEKRYESVWVDSQTTAITFFTGTRDNNTFTWTGNYTDPTNGEKKTLKATNTFQGKDTMTFTMYLVSSNGTETKTAEITYTRTGPGGPLDMTPVDSKSHTQLSSTHSAGKLPSTPVTKQLTTVTKQD